MHLVIETRRNITAVEALNNVAGSEGVAMDIAACGLHWGDEQTRVQPCTAD